MFFDNLGIIYSGIETQMVIFMTTDVKHVIKVNMQGQVH
jgi:hypothetical protein